MITGDDTQDELETLSAAVFWANSQSLARLPFHLNRFLPSSGSFSSVISASSAVLLPCVEKNSELLVDWRRTRVGSFEVET